MRNRVRSFLRTQQTLSVSVSVSLLLLVAGGLSLFLLAFESDSAPSTDRMARSFVLWLHGLGDSGPANEPIRSFFSSDAAFNLTKWAFPSAPNSPVSCNFRAIMPSWFDIHEIPISSVSSLLFFNPHLFYSATLPIYLIAFKMLFLGFPKK